MQTSFSRWLSGDVGERRKIRRDDEGSGTSSAQLGAVGHIGMRLRLPLNNDLERAPANDYVWRENCCASGVPVLVKRPEPPGMPVASAGGCVCEEDARREPTEPPQGAGEYS